MKTSAGAKQATEIPCSARSDPRLAKMTDEGIGFTSELGLPPGRYALPANVAPTQLLVMFHGHGNDSGSWRRHLQAAAARGAVAVAMDYSDQQQTPVENYGWCVRSGAADSITAARYFLARFPSIREVYAFAVSMGGNVSGYALTSPEARRADDSPLFDHWVVAEGVHDLAQQYRLARLVASMRADGARAVAEIEAENGGSVEQRPERYAEITNLNRVGELACLKSAVLVHGNDDRLVSPMQSRRMAAALVAAGVPAHLVLIGGPGQPGDGAPIVGIPLGTRFDVAAGNGDIDPTGHGWEGSDSHPVIRAAAERLWALMAGGRVESGETWLRLGG